MPGHAKNEDLLCQGIRNGQPLSTRRRQPTPSMAARIGGGDANSNPRLRTAIAAAKNENMPNDNIERAILRGTGQREGEQYEEVTFEGYGPGGVGVLIQAVTTNRNRA